jgi:uncharacterized heparinase superfamily protein
VPPLPILDARVRHDSTRVAVGSQIHPSDCDHVIADESLLAKPCRARAANDLARRSMSDVGREEIAIEHNGFQAACALSHNQGPKLDIRSNGLRGRLRLSPTKESA